MSTERADANSVILRDEDGTSVKCTKLACRLSAVDPNVHPRGVLLVKGHSGIEFPKVSATRCTEVVQG